MALDPPISGLPAPFRTDGPHLAIDLPGARALFTSRRGGISTGPYASLNLGRLTDDDPQAVEANRNALAARYGVSFAAGRQVHGTGVRVAGVADEPGRAGEPAPAADGHVTAQPGVAPMVLTADCLPVVIAGEGGVAAIHAGWRGLTGGILAEGVRALRGLGVHGPLAAAIGPGAGGCCYEVGVEVRREFARFGPDVERGAKLDLKAAARLELTAAGVAEVHDCGLCTICADPGLFFSHRRDGGLTGRQAGFAWLS